MEFDDVWKAQSVNFVDQKAFDDQIRSGKPPVAFVLVLAAVQRTDDAVRPQRLERGAQLAMREVTRPSLGIQRLEVNRTPGASKEPRRRNCGTNRTPP